MTVTLTFEWTTLIFVVAAAGIAWLHASTHELRQQNNNGEVPYWRWVPKRSEAGK